LVEDTETLAEGFGVVPDTEVEPTSGTDSNEGLIIESTLKGKG